MPNNPEILKSRAALDSVYCRGDQEIKRQREEEIQVVNEAISQTKAISDKVRNNMDALRRKYPSLNANLSPSRTGSVSTLSICDSWSVSFDEPDC